MKEIIYKLLANLDLHPDSDSLTMESGGSINSSFSFGHQGKKYFVKVNNAEQFPEMMKVEARGLSFLADRGSGAFGVPSVRHQGIIDNWQYLIMDFIDRGGAVDHFAFAKALHQLHSSECSYFGLDYDNYIGSIIQPNDEYSDASGYYIASRLEPQLELAKNNGFIFEKSAELLETVEVVLSGMRSAPIHGDLWSGNSFFDKNGLPVLIDPAVSFGIAEMDLAMMKLFGGYDQAIFEIYEQLNPDVKGWSDRLPIFQLYYLLVHLNIFGRSYLNQVNRAIASCLQIA
jgi:fructosamine-3-kinase